MRLLIGGLGELVQLLLVWKHSRHDPHASLELPGVSVKPWYMSLHVPHALTAYVYVFIERVWIIFNLSLRIPSALWVDFALIRFEKVEPSETTI